MSGTLRQYFGAHESSAEFIALKRKDIAKYLQYLVVTGQICESGTVADAMDFLRRNAVQVSEQLKSETYRNG